MLARKRVRRAAIALALGTSGALAQTPPPSVPPPVGPDPATTTATYGDWMLRCQTVTPGSSGGAKRLCEVVQTMQLHGQREPVAQVAFGRMSGGTDLHLVVALPVSISLPSRVAVALGDKDAHPLDLDWKRCIPGACFADGIAGANRVAEWRMATTAGDVVFKDASGRNVSLPLSFRGLAPALDALNAAPGSP